MDEPKAGFREHPYLPIGTNEPHPQPASAKVYGQYAAS